MARQARIDLFAAPVVLADKLEAPTPARSSAVKTRDGYLLVDGYLARDGLLRYSDGRQSWDEYRPRDELVAAAGSWQHTPVTDDHPARMVDASTWAQVARGIHVSTPVVEGPLADGVSYLRAQLLITDADLIRRLEAREVRELSIGFTAEILPAPGRVAADGTRCDAVQSGLIGNHTAIVAQGRAGPACAIMMDGAAIAVHTSQVSVSRMTKPKIKPKSPARLPASTPKLDAAGSPTDMSDITGPEGTILPVPTWLASAYDFAVANGWGGLGSKPDEPAEPEVPAGDELPPKPADPNAPPADPNKEKPPAMTPDAISALVAQNRKDAEDAANKRHALVRRADKAGIDDAAIVACADYTALARLYVGTVTPHAKAIADKLDGPALDALVEVAAAAPKAETPENPWEVRAIVKDAKDNPEVEAYARHLQAQGY